MTDIELLVREALRRHGAEVPSPDVLEARPVAVRARRRQVVNAMGAGLVALVIALGAVSGVGALLRADARRPAGEPTPTGPSVGPATDAERVGFLGLAPEGSEVSLPASGDLVISFEYFCCPGRSMYVYEDGRMIWAEYNIVPEGTKGYFPLPPQGADDMETGYLEQRLTPEGVQLLRSELVSSGLFDEDSSFVKKGEELSIGVRRDGQMITLRAAKADDPYQATPDVAREILRLTELLKAPEAWLPDEAWADPTIRAFVPSRYFVEIHFYSNGGRTPDDPSELPAPADDLLRSADVVTNNWTCQVVSPSQARHINTDLLDAFGDSIPVGSPERGVWVSIGFMGPGVSIKSALPHQMDCDALG
jgi:hypothetical protein